VESRSSFTMPAVIFAIGVDPYRFVIAEVCASAEPQSKIAGLAYGYEPRKPHSLCSWTAGVRR
jgi:hypothetical protein